MGPSTGSPDIRTAVAGVLYITTLARVLFVPNRGNLRKYSEVCEWPLSDIISVGVQGRDFTAYTGGMQKRLCLTLRDGTELLFVVTKRDRAIGELRKIIGESDVAGRR